MSWRERAACRGMDPAVFMPEPGESPELALSTCAACPVRAERLNHALEAGETTGIWGGLVPWARKQLPPPCGSAAAWRRHLRAGEACETCRMAQGLRVLERTGHGTLPGYEAHRRWGVPTCTECRAAKQAYKRARRNQRRSAA